MVIKRKRAAFRGNTQSFIHQKMVETEIQQS